MSGRLSLLPGEISFSIPNTFSDGSLEEKKSAEVIVLTKVRKDRTIINFGNQGGGYATSIAENIGIKFREMTTYERISWKQKNM